MNGRNAGLLADELSRVYCAQRASAINNKVSDKIFLIMKRPRDKQSEGRIAPLLMTESIIK